MPFPCTLWLGFRLSAVRPDAFADHLRTSECGVATSNDGLAALVANMGMPVGVAFVIATAFANISAGMNAAVATVFTKARLGFHTGRSGMMNRRSNEGVGQGSSWGTLSSCPHEFIFEFAFNLNVFLTALYLKVMRM